MSGGSFKQNPPQRSAMLSFLDGSNGPGAPASSFYHAYGLNLTPLQMSGMPEEGESSAGVTLSAWELHEMSGEDKGIKDDPKLGMKERLAIEKQQGVEFYKIHDGSHPAVAAFLVARKLALERTGKGVAKVDVTTTPMPATAVKEMVKMFESKNQQLPPASSSSTSLLPQTVHRPPSPRSSPPRAASPVPSTSKPESGPDLGQNRRSDRHTGPGFYEHRKEEDSRLDMLTTSAKHAKTPLVLPVVEKPDKAQYQASAQEPVPAAIPAGAGILALPTASSVLPLNDPIDSEVGPMRRSDRQTGPGFYEHRKDEDSRLDKLTTSAKHAKTPLVLPVVEKPDKTQYQVSPQEPVPAAIPPGEGIIALPPASSVLPQNDAIDSEVGPIRRSDRQTGPGFYEHRQDENSRLDKLTTAAKKAKTAPSPPEAGPLVRDPAGGAGQKGPASPTEELPYWPAPSSPAGEGVARYPVRQTGMGFHEFQQAENDRVNKPKKRARP